MSNILFGVVLDGPLQCKHFLTLFIISPFISVRYVSIGYLYFDHIVNETPCMRFLIVSPIFFFMPSFPINVYYRLV
jgi:hypothetical protein